MNEENPNIYFAIACIHFSVTRARLTHNSFHTMPIHSTTKAFILFIFSQSNVAAGYLCVYCFAVGITSLPKKVLVTAILTVHFDFNRNYHQNHWPKTKFPHSKVTSNTQ